MMVVTNKFMCHQTADVLNLEETHEGSWQLVGLDIQMPHESS